MGFVPGEKAGDAAVSVNDGSHFPISGIRITLELEVFYAGDPLRKTDKAGIDFA
jgi:hypothetical protein